MKNYLKRITLNPAVCGGKPTIRNMRFTVSQLLDLLASGMSINEVLSDYPYLEKQDVLGCLHYASKMANTKDVRNIAD
jgi:uncharacterized protein (DUF433 family)